MVTQDSPSYDRYPIPAAPARVEARFVNSRFIGSANHTPGVSAAKDFIAQVRAELPGATHHAYAYLIGYGASVTAGMSDAGEPSGTAGRPMLSILRGSGLGDVTVVVTRFFGGTLLGTGGLVHAYGDTTREVLAVLPRTEWIATRTVRVRVPYSAYEMTRQALLNHNATISDEAFVSDVTMMATLPLNQIEACRAAIARLTAGQAILHPE